MKTALSGSRPDEDRAGAGTVRDLALFLNSLGSREVVTDKGTMPAKTAARLVLAGAVRELVVPRLGSVRIDYPHVHATKPIPKQSAYGLEPGELTYSSAELELVKLADLAMLLGMDSVSFTEKALSDPGGLLADVIEIIDNKKESPLYPRLRSRLHNLIDILVDIMVQREGDRSDVLSRYLVSTSNTGEFDEISRVKHRLHASRTIKNLLTGDLRFLYKTYASHGLHYVVVFDKSGSMATRSRTASRKAIGALVAALISRSDPEARFSLVVFDTAARILAVESDSRAVLDHILELEADGGTRYASGLRAASQVLRDGDVLVVIGDYEDSVFPDQSTALALKEKASKRLLIPVGDANSWYLRRLAKLISADIVVYTRGALRIVYDI